MTTIPQCISKKRNANSKRVTIQTDSKWEPLIGYARAVRIGNQIFISGTTATNKNGGIVGGGNVQIQTTQIIKNINLALEKAGGKLEHVVRTRIYLTNINDWSKVAKIHNKFFERIRPACTLMEVRSLISPELLIEIEADAIVT